MARSESIERYNIASIVLHWGMLILIVATYAAIEFREYFPKGSDLREALKAWHFALGLSILGLVWLRIIARLLFATPRPMNGSPSWQQIAAHAVQFALYLFMIGMPILGWLILNAEGKTVTYLTFDVPILVHENRSLSEPLEGVHELGGTIGYFLIGTHAAAALFHHYFLRDGILMRMIPRRV